MKYLGDDKDELWDIYDQDRKLTGKLHRRGDPMIEGEYHMVVHVCIFDQSGRMLIQKRNQWKAKFPGMWDISVGGAAQHGDDSRHAAEREAMEEIGLQIDLSKERPVFSLNFREGFDDYYFITIPNLALDKFVPQPEEVDELAWVTEEELLSLAAENQFVPYLYTDKLFTFYDLKYRRTTKSEK